VQWEFPELLEEDVVVTGTGVGKGVTVGKGERVGRGVGVVYV
jgi:hypothetical protein